MGFGGGRDAEVLRLGLRRMGNGCGCRELGGGAEGGFGIGFLEGEFLVTKFSFESLVGDLAGVEEFSGALFVEGFCGEAVGDLAGGVDDGVAVGERVEVEAAVGADVDGRGLDAVVDAEVLADDGGFGAAGLVVEVLEALVELVGMLLVGTCVVHGYPPPPQGGCGKRGFEAKGKGPAGAGPSVFALLFKYIKLHITRCRENDLGK